MRVMGVDVPAASEVFTFIQRNFSSAEEKDQACAHAWETYMYLGDLVRGDRIMFDTFYREAYIMMGAHWAYSDS